MHADSAILKALNVGDGSVNIKSHGGSGFTSTYKVSVVKDKSTNIAEQFFLKVAPGQSAKTMFEGEHASLRAIYTAVPSLCPNSIAVGELERRPGTHFLLTEFIEVGHAASRSQASSSNRGSSGMSLAQKLAKLHTTLAPMPPGSSNHAFGFPVTTCCGDTPQPNDFKANWSDFYAENRLLAVLAKHEAAHGRDKELRVLVERTVDEVVPRLLGKGHLGGERGIMPVVVHGDLWSGNKLFGKILRTGDGDFPAEELIFDPSSCYAHSEYELGIMRMFGGFGGDFLHEYHGLVPKTEPIGEYEDRISLYELYHHLNHTAIFGGSYRSGAISIMRDLLKKYGNKD